MLAMYPHSTPGTDLVIKGISFSPASKLCRKISIPPEWITRLGQTTVCSGRTCLTTRTSWQPDRFNNVFLNSHTRRETVILEESHTFVPVLSMPCEVVTAALTCSTIPASAINPAAASCRWAARRVKPRLQSKSMVDFKGIRGGRRICLEL